MDEFKVYFRVISHEISDEEAIGMHLKPLTPIVTVYSAAKNVSAAKKFFYGLEETELSGVFYGK